MGFFSENWISALARRTPPEDLVMNAFALAVEKGTPLEIRIFGRDLIAHCHDNGEAVDFFYEQAELLHDSCDVDDCRALAIETVMLPFGVDRKTGRPDFPREISDIFFPRSREFLNCFGEAYAREGASQRAYVESQREILRAAGIRENGPSPLLY